MKRKSILIIIAALTAVMCFMFTACGGPANLEEYINSDSDMQEEINESASDAGMTVEIKENDVIYTYDLSSLGYDESTIKNDTVVKALKDALNDQSSTFEGLCKSIEDETGFEGVQMIVNYTYGEEVLVTKTFKAAAE